jgi:hypothetical protein
MSLFFMTINAADNQLEMRVISLSVYPYRITFHSIFLFILFYLFAKINRLMNMYAGPDTLMNNLRLSPRANLFE